MQATDAADSTAFSALPPTGLALDNPLWRFALEQWREAGLQTACLACQAQGWCVSHLLVALWAGHQGLVWEGDEPQALTIWRARVTQSLRHLRQALPQGHVALKAMRHCLQEAELASEQIELAWWFHELSPRLRAAESREDADVLIIANLSNLARRQRVAVDASLQQLALVFCPTLSPDRIQRLFEQPAV